MVLGSKRVTGQRGIAGSKPIARAKLPWDQRSLWDRGDCRTNTTHENDKDCDSQVDRLAEDTWSRSFYKTKMIAGCNKIVRPSKIVGPKRTVTSRASRMPRNGSHAPRALKKEKNTAKIWKILLSPSKGGKAPTCPKVFFPT